MVLRSSTLEISTIKTMATNLKLWEDLLQILFDLMMKLGHIFR